MYYVHFTYTEFHDVAWLLPFFPCVSYYIMYFRCSLFPLSSFLRASVHFFHLLYCMSL